MPLSSSQTLSGWYARPVGWAIVALNSHEYETQLHLSYRGEAIQTALNSRVVVSDELVVFPDHVDGYADIGNVLR